MPLRHILLAVGVAVIWGGNFIVVRVGLDGGLPPLLFATLRFGVAFLPAVFVARPAGVSWRMLCALGLILGVGQFGLSTLGVALGMSAGVASVVMQTNVFFTMGLAALLLGERLRPPVVLGAAVSFSGIVLLGVRGGAAVTLPGLLMCTVSAFMWAYGIILAKRLAGVNMLQLTVWLSLPASAALLLFSLLMEGSPVPPLARQGWGAVGLVLYAGLLSSVVGASAWTGLLRRYPAQNVAPFALLVPVFALVMASLLLRERLDAASVAATLLVLFGLVPAVAPPGLLRRWGLR